MTHAYHLGMGPRRELSGRRKTWLLVGPLLMTIRAENMLRRIHLVRLALALTLGVPPMVFAQSSPVITLQPLNLTAAIGDYPLFSVSAAGAAPFSWQWRFNEVNITGATNFFLQLSAVGTNQAGIYSVVVADNGGSVTSVTASLTITPAPLPWGFALIHLFSGGIDGAAPYSSLLQTPDGSFYGVTYRGGASGNGTVFKIDSAGKFFVLHAFTGGLHGGSPAGSLIQATDGNFYGTTIYGGSVNGGTVFRLTPSGDLLTLHDLTGPDGSYPESGLTLGFDGALYGTTGGIFFGNLGVTGEPIAGSVFRITIDDSFKNLYSFPLYPDPNGLTPLGNLIQMPDGRFLGTASGVQDPIDSPRPFTIGIEDASVFAITTNGLITILYSFSDGHYGTTPETGLTSDVAGNVYGTTSHGGLIDGTVFKIDPTGIFTVLHQFTSNGDGGPPESGLLATADGNLYGTTSEAGLITYTSYGYTFDLI